MNKKQLLTIWLSVIVISALALIPPWQYRFKVDTESLDLDQKVPGPYRLILLGAPEVPVTSTRMSYYNNRQEYFQKYERKYWKVEIDWVRFLIPIGVIVLITSALVITFQTRNR